MTVHAESNRPDVVLIYPFLEDASWKNDLRSKDNLALGYLAASLRKAGYTVALLHAEHLKWGSDRVASYVAVLRPRLIGFSCTAQRGYAAVKESARGIKAHLSVPIVLGGVFPTVAHREILDDCPDIDAVCRGEGEHLIVELLDRIECPGRWNEILGLSYRAQDNQIAVNDARPLIANLDEIPFPDRDYLSEMQAELSSGLYYVNISSGRGCYARCTFCSTRQLFHGRRRVRTPHNVVDEIQFCIDRYGVRYFKFIDEVFIEPRMPAWIDEFCSLIRARSLQFRFHIEVRVDGVREELLTKLVDVGLDEVFVGLESGSNTVLHRYRKGQTIDQAEHAVVLLRRLNIKAQFGFIMIDPLLSFEELEDNMQWLSAIGDYSRHNLYNKLNIYYGTDLYHDLARRGLLCPTPFDRRQDYRYQDARVERFVELVEIAKEAFRSYDMMSNDFIKSLATSPTPTEWRPVAQRLNGYTLSLWHKLLLAALTYVRAGIDCSDVWEQYINRRVGLCEQRLSNEEHAARTNSSQMSPSQEPTDNTKAEEHLRLWP